VHGGQTLLEWSHGRIRSNVSAEDDDRKVGSDTIWRVASITKVIVHLSLTNIVGVHCPRSIGPAE
jgi:CubicO group peptidase (beta-lactamase class C family)